MTNAFATLPISITRNCSYLFAIYCAFYAYYADKFSHQSGLFNPIELPLDKSQPTIISGADLRGLSTGVNFRG